MGHKIDGNGGKSTSDFRVTQGRRTPMDYFLLNFDFCILSAKIKVENQHTHNKKKNTPTCNYYGPK